MPLANFYLEPKANTYFGSAKGKFKYALGLHAGVDGFLPSGIYYSALFGYNLFGDLHDVRDLDRLNPSQLINVRTDIVNYFKVDGITVTSSTYKKTGRSAMAFTPNWLSATLRSEYAGLAAEALWYPLKYPFAAGLEGAVFKKRNYQGLGFQSKIRKLDGFTPTYRKFTGSQYFLNLYYRWYQAELDFSRRVSESF